MRPPLSHFVTAPLQGGVAQYMVVRELQQPVQKMQRGGAECAHPYKVLSIY